jgi:uncharacterized Zn finger protein
MLQYLRIGIFIISIARRGGKEMNLTDFKNKVNEVILERGYHYFADGNVVEFHQINNNEYVCQVHGSDVYHVTVKISSKGEIMESNCDCPYDFDAICKHQVAAFYELANALKSSDKTNEIHPDFHEVLKSLPKEKLMNIIMDIVEENLTLKNRLILKYYKGDKKQELSKCKRLIDGVVRKYKGRGDFITYREVYRFAGEMRVVLEKARETEDILLALDIAFLLLNKAVGAFQYADDSDGEIGYLVSETIETIREIATEKFIGDNKVRDKVFGKLLKESNSKVFEGWEEFQLDILEICAEFEADETHRKQLKIKIETLLEGNTGDYYKEYYNERLLQLLFMMIKRHESEAEVDQFISENLHFSSFRNMLMDKCMAQGNYQKVIELALEGETQDKEYAGLQIEWKKRRHAAYKELSWKDEQEKLARELFMSGEFEYYRELIELTQEDKQDFYYRLKQELKQKNGWSITSLYLRLLEEEQDLDGIMEYVRSNPTSIERYMDLLLENYEEEVIEIFGSYIRSNADLSSNRKQYKSVCKLIKTYKKISGKEKQKILIDELKEKHLRRPAFLDELSKLK